MSGEEYLPELKAMPTWDDIRGLFSRDRMG